CFFNLAPHIDTSTPSLHDALPICEQPPATLGLPPLPPPPLPPVPPLPPLPPEPPLPPAPPPPAPPLPPMPPAPPVPPVPPLPPADRKSTRLNSSHVESSYALFDQK